MTYSYLTGPVRMGQPQSITSELQRVQAERARLCREQEELARQVRRDLGLTSVPHTVT